MKTAITDSIHLAASFIRRGELAAFPTETVYGLGANAFDAKAVRKIYIAKGRPSDNPIIVHIHSKSQLPLVASKITPSAEKLIAKFFPGPISVILPRNPKIPPIVSAGLPTVCVRMPKSRICQSFLRACSVPVAAPSANISGRPSPTTWQHVLHDLKGKIPIILKGPPCRHGVESTVVDCTKKIQRLLRAGAITAEQLEKVVGKITLPANAGIPLSPGMKYRHYAPDATVFIVPGAKSIPPSARNFAYMGFDRCPGADLSISPKTHASYAKSLFSFFRKCDREKIEFIFAQEVPKTGIGRAIMERLKKASKG